GDTVLGTMGRTRRSLDGGRTWAQVHDFGRDGLARGPGARLLTTSEGVAYSDDRGAMWTEAQHPGVHGTEALLTRPPAPGRPHPLVLSGGWDGVAASADSGRTFAPTPLWGLNSYPVEEMTAVATPGAPAGSQTVIAVGWQVGMP